MKKKDKFRKKKICIWSWFEDHMTPCIVTFSILVVSAFSIVDMIAAYNGISFSDTLIEWIYKFFGLEMLGLSGIKISKHIGSAFGKIESVIDGSECFDAEYDENSTEEEN